MLTSQTSSGSEVVNTDLDVKAASLVLDQIVPILYATRVSSALR